MDNWRESVAVILGVFLGIALLVWAVTYTRHDRITVHERYWRYDISVKYDETETHLETYTENVCRGRGYGEDRVCQPETRTRLETETHTYTRCSDYLIGIELPPIRPDVPCQMLSGDYIQENTSYHVSFTLEDEAPRGRLDRTFPSSLWERFEPGVMRDVDRDLLGNIRGLTQE